jgi:tRNA (guanine37-N1)-methyltransferase
MDIDILSLFPEYFDSPFACSMIKRAREKGLLNIRCINIRDFAEDKHQTVDDRPYGGGPGMVMKPEPTIKAIQSVKRENSHVVYLSPQGRMLKAGLAEEFAKQYEHIILLCGHYEGIDQRIIDSEVDEELSIGNYVLTSGSPAAIVFVDAVCRFIPGVIGHPEAAYKDSFHVSEVFEGPQYTRPFEYDGKKVPEVLVNGNHKEIEKWRDAQGKIKALSFE